MNQYGSLSKREKRRRARLLREIFYGETDAQRLARRRDVVHGRLKGVQGGNLPGQVPPAGNDG
jgi:hypothetical protein